MSNSHKSRSFVKVIPLIVMACLICIILSLLMIRQDLLASNANDPNSKTKPLRKRNIRIKLHDHDTNDDKWALFYQFSMDFGKTFTVTNFLVENTNVKKIVQTKISVYDGTIIRFTCESTSEINGGGNELDIRAFDADSMKEDEPDKSKNNEYHALFLTPVINPYDTNHYKTNSLMNFYVLMPSDRFKIIPKVKWDFMIGSCVLLVDANRDGKITSNEEDETSQNKPYYMWVNDDHDVPCDDANVEGDANPHGYYGGTMDYMDEKLTTKRDLEDLTRLWIELPMTLDAIKKEKIEVGLRWKKGQGMGSPIINVYSAVIPTRDFMLSKAHANVQLLSSNSRAKLIVRSDTPARIPQEMIHGDDNKLYFLIEGALPGSGYLEAVLLDGDKEITTTAGVWLDINRVRDYIETYTVGEGNGTDPTFLSKLYLGYKSHTVDERNKTIVFVHGWDMAPWEKDYFAETAYKRLWHQGYKGRFLSFRWPTAYGFNSAITPLTNPQHYDRSEKIAWQSGKNLAVLLMTLRNRGQVHLVAHSMGNIVAGEAIRILKQYGITIDTYVAMQAAVPIEMYDQPHQDERINFNADVLWGPEPNYDSGTPDVAIDWFSGTPGKGGVTRMINFENRNDFALNQKHWEFNQMLKPDNGYGYDRSKNEWYWIYRPNMKDQNTIYKKLNLGSNQRINEVKDMFDIFSFITEYRGRALGRIDRIIPIFNTVVNVEEIWRKALNQDKKWEAAGGEWHSGQFRFSMVEQNQFWTMIYEEIIGSKPFTK